MLYPCDLVTSRRIFPHAGWPYFWEWPYGFRICIRYDECSELLLARFFRITKVKTPSQGWGFYFGEPNVPNVEHPLP